MQRSTTSCKRKAERGIMSRLLSFETLHNTRDLGGMRAADGRRIKNGRLIRSARLSDISTHDQEVLAGLLDTVVDFRDVAERLEHPDTDLKGVTCIDLPLLDQLAAGVTRDVNSEQEMLSKTVDDPVKAIRIISGIYTSLVMNEFIVSQYGRFLRILLEQHDKAVLWHCSGGKDRAGIGAVLVEEILGVPREDIVADYMKTNDYLSESKETMIQHVKQKVPAGTKISCEALECLYYAKREYIDAFYHAVEQKYGDIRTFLQEGLQLTQEDIDRMREMYLEELY